MSASIHEHPEEWLATALADGLSPEERRTLDEHLAGCERCRTLRDEFAELDATLLREMPAAVGPAPGFEARLVAGFRRRRGGERLARLGALLGWLVRQRGVRVAGVAAALLALVGLGQFITRKEARVVDGAAIQNLLQDRSGETEVLGVLQQADPSFSGGGNLSAPVVVAESSKVLSSDVINQPVFRTSRSDAGKANFDGLINYGSPIQPTTRAYRNATTLDAGGTAITSASGTVSNGPLPLALLDGTKIKGVDDITGRYGFTEKSEIKDTRQPLPSTTPAPTDQSFNFAGAPVLAPAPDVAATSAPPDVRKLIRNAHAELEVTSFDAAVDAVTAAAERGGGFLDTRDSARGGNGKVTGTLVVKVLPENLDRFLTGLRALGDLKNQTIQTEDVTKDYFDTDARLRNSHRMEDRLLKMLDEVKGKMSEVLQVEKELARVRADIETMQGQLKLYDAQVRYATVTLGVYERDLRQPAAFLLHENATLSLLAADVERTAAEARRIADAAHVQTLRSEISRDGSGQARATLRLLIAPEASAEVIAQIKTLGRVENFRLQDERTAQNGVTSEAAGTDSAKVEHAPVTLDLTISHDEQISRQISFTLVAADARAAFEKARAAAQAAGGEIVEANLARTPDGHASATLGIRAPSAAQAALVTSLQALGRAGELETRRVGSGPETPSDAAGPVLIQLSIVDAEPAVQRTVVRVRTGEVERGADEIKREAAAGHAQVEASDFSSGDDGAQHAELRFRLPMNAYAGFIERVRALGAVQDFTVERKDRPEKAGGETEAGAPVVVELTLYNEGRIVGESSGLGTTLRRTFGQGTEALMWSVRMIGVALAFVAPWAVLLALAALGIRWSRQRARTRSANEKTL